MLLRAQAAALLKQRGHDVANPLFGPGGFCTSPGERGPDSRCAACYNAGVTEPPLPGGRYNGYHTCEGSRFLAR
jgi:hypothetical protein